MNERIILGGGCFWCTEAVFKRIKGVTAVTPGYAGGKTRNPTYDEVCGGDSGHAEVVKVEFDPHVIALEGILEVFFHSHDPTTHNRQGNDVGSQYRSLIVCASADQENAVREYLKKIRKEYDKPITTEVVEDAKFYPAEKANVDFYKKNPLNPYCILVIRPKVKKIESLFPDKVGKVSGKRQA